MFGRRKSVHGRLMGEVRSAQQKCVRRAMLEPLILLNLEHLLSSPDFSLAALRRMQIIAAEDIGAASITLCHHLVKLEERWLSLSVLERARRLIIASYLCVQTECSRFIPHWAVTLIDRVDLPKNEQSVESIDTLLYKLRTSLVKCQLDSAGITAEEIFLRHPLHGEEHLPSPLHLSEKSMKLVWDTITSVAKKERITWINTWRDLFGTPSIENISSRLFLYLSIVDTILEPTVVALEVPEISDNDVTYWINRAKVTAFEIPDWMMDKHTASGQHLGRGQLHFLNTAAMLVNNSNTLGKERENTVREEAQKIYLKHESLFGRASRTAHIRERWRENAKQNLLKQSLETQQ